MNKGLKIFISVILIVLTIFLITNPSMKDFEEYLPPKKKDISFRRTNYLIYSVFVRETKGITYEYLGVFKNFFPKLKELPDTHYRVADSLANVISSSIEASDSSQKPKFEETLPVYNK